MSADTTPPIPSLMGEADFRRLVAAVVADALAAGVQGRPAPLLLTTAEAIQFTGVSRAGFFRLRSADKLPKPVAVEGIGVRYRRADLEKWAERLKAERRTKSVLRVIDE